MRWILPCPKGCESVLEAEVRALGIEVTDVHATVVQARGPLRDGYALCLGSRVASRVLLPLLAFDGEDDTALYEAVCAVPWWDHFDVTRTIAIGGSQGPRSQIPSHYWIQRTKDAIVDSFRSHGGRRPSVDKKDPDIRLHLHIGEGRHELSLDFSGGGQHRRGYRRSGGRAPLKENLAAAILYLSGWPAAAEAGLALCDPTCGSGTFLVEAALMATHSAPGLLRDRFGFEFWRGHDRALFREVRNAAVRRRRDSFSGSIHGFDASATAISEAEESLRAAGMQSLVTLKQASLTELTRPADRGVLVCNPPYGHRLGDEDTLFLLYQGLGDVLKREFDGWTAFVFAAQGPNLKHLGLRPAKRHVLFNGAIECRLLEIPITGGPSDAQGVPGWRKPSDKAQMFVNRIRKNRKKRERWARRAGIEAYRLYDADIPEYRVAVDRYGTKAVVQVYQRSQEMDDAAAKQRVQDVLLTLPEALDIPLTDLVVKVRRRQDQGDQYDRLAEQESDMIVAEGEMRFVVNLEDRIDTGLFVDHRRVRAYAKEHCADKRMLNLFAYTCSVSVAAAHGGARQTTSVDLSNTYLDWGKRNFVANDLDPGRHQFLKRDAMRWKPGRAERYDWVFINPPTFSRSKMSKDNFSVHRDHRSLLERTMEALNPEGEVLFTTHAHGFEIHSDLRERFDVTNCTREFVPEDFTRSGFSAFFLRHRGSR